MRTIYREHGVRGETDERGSGSGSALLAARPAFRFDFSVIFNETEMYGASIFTAWPSKAAQDEWLRDCAKPEFR
jgi:hypothetical protein